MGHKYSLILSREITDEESAILQDSGCYGATFATGTLPTDPKVKVTTVDVDDTVSPSLEKAIESGLDAVIQVPDLSAPGLRVPALPVEKRADQLDVVTGEVIDDELAAGRGAEVAEVTTKPAVIGNGSAKRAANRKTAESAGDAKELSEAGAAAD